MTLDEIVSGMFGGMSNQKPKQATAPQTQLGGLGAYSRGYAQGGLLSGLDAAFNGTPEDRARLKAEQEAAAARAQESKRLNMTMQVLRSKAPQLGLTEDQLRLAETDPEIRNAFVKSYLMPQAPGKPEDRVIKDRLVRVNPDGSTKVLYEPPQEEGGVTGPYKDMKEKADVESGVRKEVNALSKDYFVVRDSEAKIQAIASNPSAASDLALIFSFMKVLDPSSVVREQEFANAQNAAGVPDQVRNMYNRIISGERLGEAQRADFIAQARTIAQQQRSSYERTLGQYKGIAERYQLDPRNVVPEYGQDQLRNEAMEAIKQGADRNAVREELLKRGIDPAGL